MAKYKLKKEFIEFAREWAWRQGDNWPNGEVGPLLTLCYSDLEHSTFIIVRGRDSIFMEPDIYMYNKELDIVGFFYNHNINQFFHKIPIYYNHIWRQLDNNISNH